MTEKGHELANLPPVALWRLVRGRRTLPRQYSFDLFEMVFHIILFTVVMRYS